MLVLLKVVLLRCLAAPVRPARYVVLATALTVALSPAATAHETYVVQGGDTLSELAVDFGTTLEDLAGVNGVGDPDRIYVGQRLDVPKGSRAQRYVVRPGDTLSGIAAAHDVSVDVLARANGIANPNRLFAGRSLTIVEHAPALPSVGNTGTHVVARGETLSEIAAAYRVDADALARANGIDDPDWIRAGMTLSLPGAWLCPVRGPVRFVNDFGYVKPSGRVHQGVDLYAARGTPVVAPVAGRVARTVGNVGGLQLSLYGVDGHRYFFSHLDRFGANGQVAAGEVVGYVGDTGNARGAPTHVHFEFHPGNGAASSPYAILSDAC